MATVRLVVEMPDAKLEEFLRLLRAWDDKKQDRHLEIVIEASDMSKDDILAMLNRMMPAYDNLWCMPIPKDREGN